MKYLQKQLGDIKKEKEKEIQDRNEMIAHLKDQLQEMKAKTNMEGKYSKKCTEVRVAQTQKKCTIEEKNMKDDIEVKSLVCPQFCRRVPVAFYNVPALERVWGNSSLYGDRGEALWQKMVLGHFKGLK